MFNNPSAAKILRFLRILPMVRVRDGIRNVLRNLETMRTISEVLDHDVPYCVFSEGTHRTRHSLLPIKKGIIRTAFTADETMKEGKTIWLVPIGLEYGDYLRYHSTSLMEFGEPINFTEFVRTHPDMVQADIYRQLGAELQSRISSLITYIGDDEDYEAKWALVKMLTAGTKGSLVEKRNANKAAVATIEEKFEKDKEGTSILLQKAAIFESKRITNRLSIYSFGHKRLALTVVLKALAAAAMLPYFIFCAVTMLPAWVASAIICARTKDNAFHNSMKMVVKLLLTPLLLIGWAIVGFCKLHWAVALAGLILAVPAYGFFYDYLEFIRRFVSDVRLLWKKDLREEFKNIKNGIL